MALKNNLNILTFSNSENTAKMTLNYAVLIKSVTVQRAIDHKLRKEIIETIDANQPITVTSI